MLTAVSSRSPRLLAHVLTGVARTLWVEFIEPERLTCAGSSVVVAHGEDMMWD